MKTVTAVELLWGFSQGGSLFSVLRGALLSARAQGAWLLAGLGAVPDHLLLALFVAGPPSTVLCSSALETSSCLSTGWLDYSSVPSCRAHGGFCPSEALVGLQIRHTFAGSLSSESCSSGLRYFASLRFGLIGEWNWVEMDVCLFLCWILLSGVECGKFYGLNFTSLKA